MHRLIVAIMASAFASGAFANTETERQSFASEVECAAESANDGVLILAQQS